MVIVPWPLTIAVVTYSGSLTLLSPCGLLNSGFNDDEAYGTRLPQLGLGAAWGGGGHLGRTCGKPGASGDRMS